MTLIITFVVLCGGLTVVLGSTKECDNIDVVQKVWGSLIALQNFNTRGITEESAMNICYEKFGEPDQSKNFDICVELMTKIVPPPEPLPTNVEEWIETNCQRPDDNPAVDKAPAADAANVDSDKSKSEFGGAPSVVGIDDGLAAVDKPAEQPTGRAMETIDDDEMISVFNKWIYTENNEIYDNFVDKLFEQLETEKKTQTEPSGLEFFRLSHTRMPDDGDLKKKLSDFVKHEDVRPDTNYPHVMRLMWLLFAVDKGPKGYLDRNEAEKIGLHNCLDELSTNLTYRQAHECLSKPSVVKQKHTDRRDLVSSLFNESNINDEASKDKHIFKKHLDGKTIWVDLRAALKRLATSNKD